MVRKWISKQVCKALLPLCRIAVTWNVDEKRKQSMRETIINIEYALATGGKRRED